MRLSLPAAMTAPCYFKDLKLVNLSDTEVIEQVKITLQITPPYVRRSVSMQKQRQEFSMQKKLLLIFGFLIAISAIIQGLFAVQTARTAITERVETHLKDKVVDTATLIESRITALFQFLDGIARMPVLRDTSITLDEKMQILAEESKANQVIQALYIADKTGTVKLLDGSVVSDSDKLWFKISITGSKFFSEPYFDKENGNMFIADISVPVYDNENNIIGVLVADIDGLWLSAQIQDIVVGKTGYCYILGMNGIDIADSEKNIEWVKSQKSATEEAQKNSSFASLASFEAKAMAATTTDVDFFWFEGVYHIAAFAKIKMSTVIIMAPVHEFMGAVNDLQQRMIIIGMVILLISLAVTLLVSRQIVHPILTVVMALKDIAEDGGDLTVRLPLIGNDEITRLSDYFNQTIAKIGTSMSAVEKNTIEMSNIGKGLASDMTETASAVHQISANIEGVKHQTQSQSAGIAETAATVEEIIRTIKQLNTSIENQADSVAQSSSAIEEMTANISSITHTLDKTNDTIHSLAAATADGKETIAGANSATQKIAEESGSLLEASNVIQHIASQTNLLAMNAAIEAAHAGESGKGFAVVADEIRKLAEESSIQGKAITATLKALSAEIEMLSSAAKTAEEKFNAIFNLSDEVKGMSNRLMEAMQEQESGSREVLHTIRAINTVTMEVSAGSTEMLKGSEGVAEEMRKLDNLTRIIVDSMNEMASGAVEISNTVQDVNEITQKNKASIENLAAEVKKFKLEDFRMFERNG